MSCGALVLHSLALIAHATFLVPSEAISFTSSILVTPIDIDSIDIDSIDAGVVECRTTFDSRALVLVQPERDLGEIYPDCVGGLCFKFQ